MSKGKILGDQQYKVGDIISHGAFSTVYYCTDLKTGRQHAVKVLSKATVAKHGMAKALCREINAMELAPKSRFLTNLVDKLESTRNYYIIMDLAEGGTVLDALRSLQTGAGAHTSRIRNYFRHLLNGLRVLHDSNIVHRDIKPENLLLDKRGTRLMISDFGFACYAPSDRRLQRACGTLRYCAPELLVENPSYDGRKVDIWASGVTLYVMLFKMHPFEGRHGGGADSIIESITRGKYTLPYRVSSSVEHLLSAMLQTDPEKRWPLDQLQRHAWVLGVDDITINFPTRVIARSRSCAVAQNDSGSEPRVSLLKPSPGSSSTSAGSNGATPLTNGSGTPTSAAVSADYIVHSHFAKELMESTADYSYHLGPDQRRRSDFFSEEDEPTARAAGRGGGRRAGVGAIARETLAPLANGDRAVVSESLRDAARGHVSRAPVASSSVRRWRSCPVVPHFTYWDHEEEDDDDEDDDDGEDEYESDSERVSSEHDACAALPGGEQLGLLSSDDLLHDVLLASGPPGDEAAVHPPGGWACGPLSPEAFPAQSQTAAVGGQGESLRRRASRVRRSDALRPRSILVFGEPSAGAAMAGSLRTSPLSSRSSVCSRFSISHLGSTYSTNSSTSAYSAGNTASTVSSSPECGSAGGPACAISSLLLDLRIVLNFMCVCTALVVGSVLQALFGLNIYVMPLPAVVRVWFDYLLTPPYTRRASTHSRRPSNSRFQSPVTPESSDTTASSESGGGGGVPRRLADRVREALVQPSTRLRSKLGLKAAPRNSRVYPRRPLKNYILSEAHGQLPPRTEPGRSDEAATAASVGPAQCTAPQLGSVGSLTDVPTPDSLEFVSCVDAQVSTSQTCGGSRPEPALPLAEHAWQRSGANHSDVPREHGERRPATAVKPPSDTFGRVHAVTVAVEALQAPEPPGRLPAWPRRIDPECQILAGGASRAVDQETTDGCLRGGPGTDVHLSSSAMNHTRPAHGVDSSTSPRGDRQHHPPRPVPPPTGECRAAEPREAVRRRSRKAPLEPPAPLATRGLARAASHIALSSHGCVATAAASEASLLPPASSLP